MAVQNNKSLLKLEMDNSVLNYEATEDALEFNEIEFEIETPVDITDPRQVKIYQELSDIEKRLEIIGARVDELNVDIDRLTNHADGLDYTIAVASGIMTGLIDSFFVGEFDFKSAKDKSNKAINDFIMKFAKSKGYSGDRLNGAISFLEEKYKVVQDNAWSGKGIGVSASSHHLDDLAHHPTLLGLFASILVEFFRVGFFLNKDGEIHFTLLETDPKDLIKRWLPVIMSGLLLWIARMAENHYENKMDEEIPKTIKNIITALASAPMAISVLKVAGNWAGHLVSDMGGSKNTAGGGMGIPGMFLSLLKEISMLPGINMTPLPKIVNDLYTKGKFDLRSELAVLHELGRQAIPVIINELLVRGFYFVRHLITELKDKKDFKSVDWYKTIPFGNRTVERMITIATGTFTAVDLADAGIRAVAKNGLTPAALGSFVLRVNFVGIGRFAIAVATDVGMGISKRKKENEKIRLSTEQLKLLGIKLSYLEEDMWISAEDSTFQIERACVSMGKAIKSFENSTKINYESLETIKSNSKNINQNHPSLLGEIKELDRWG